MIEIRAKDRPQNCNDVIKMLIETPEEKCSQCGTTTSALTKGICKNCSTVDLGKACKKCHKNFNANELDNGICEGCKEKPKSKTSLIITGIIFLLLAGGIIIYSYTKEDSSKADNNSSTIQEDSECTESDKTLGLC